MSPDEKSTQPTDEERHGCLVFLIVLGTWFFWYLFLGYLAEQKAPLIYNEYYIAYIVPPLVGGILLGLVFRKWLRYAIIVLVPIIVFSLIILIGEQMDAQITLIELMGSSILSGILGTYAGSIFRRILDKL